MSEMVETDIEQGRPNYFQDVNEFGMFLDNMGKMVHKIKEANQEYISATGSAAMKEIKGRMMEDIDEVGKMAQIMKEKLRKMIRNNVDNRKNPGCERGTAIDISRMSLTIALKTRLKERKSDLQSLGKTIREEYLKVIQRRIFIVTGIKLSDEVICVIDTRSVVQMLENALQGISAEQMAAAVAEIKERHVAATDFDKKILEVQKNFEEMASLVEKVQKIDTALDKVVKLARSADEELRDARKKNDVLVTTVICMGLGLLIFAYVIFVLALNLAYA